jgi:lysophospholipase L1-like esterase
VSEGPDPTSNVSPEGSQTPPIPFYRRLLYHAAPYVILASLLVAAESTVRLLLPNLPALEVFVQPPELRPNLAEKIDSSVFTGDPLLMWGFRPNLKDAYWDFTLITTNAQGLRHEGNVGKKQPGALRIVCLGDSVTFGYRVPLCFPDNLTNVDRQYQCYPILLEKRLRDMNPGRQVEVYSMAVPAYTSYQGLNWLRRDIGSLKPDIVTICFGWNDVSARPLTDRQAMPNDWFHVTSRWLLAHSQALTHFSRWRHTRNVKKQPAPGPWNTHRVPQDEFVANNLEMARIARANGAQPVLIGTIYRDSQANPGEAALIKQYRDALRAAATASNIPFLEMTELTEAGFPDNSRLFGESIHPNGWGHEHMRDYLFKFLSDQGMLKAIDIPKKPPTP